MKPISWKNLINITNILKVIAYLYAMHCNQQTFATRRLPSLSNIRIALTIYIEGSCNMHCDKCYVAKYKHINHKSDQCEQCHLPCFF